MKKLLNKEMIEKAIADLTSSGKKVTNEMIYAALGSRGSFGTIGRLRRELEADKQPVTHSEEGFKRFQEIWAQAKEEGRKEREAVIADLKEDIQSLEKDNERREGEAMAAENQASEFQQIKSAMESELATLRSQFATSQQAVIQSGQETQAALAKLSAEQYAHQQTQQQLKEAMEKAHTFELELVRCRTLLDISGKGSTSA